MSLDDRLIRIVSIFVFNSILASDLRDNNSRAVFELSFKSFRHKNNA